MYTLIVKFIFLLYIISCIIADVQGEVNVAASTSHSDDPLQSKTPLEFTLIVKGWMTKKRLSVAFLAENVTQRSQGTLSSLLNNPPEIFPAGAGRETWTKLGRFMNDPKCQDALLEKFRGEIYQK